jgi:flagellar basal body-associated protein FliL
MMFNPFKSVASKILATVTLVAISLAGIFYWQYSSQQKTLVTTKVELGKAQAKIEEQQKTLEQKKESDKVTDKVQIQVVTETKLLKETTAQIEARVRDRIRELRASLPHDSRDAQVIDALNHEISKVRMQGLWEMFCVNNPHSSDCKDYVPAAPAPGASK